MPEYKVISNEQLIANIRQGWSDLMSFLMTLTPEKVLIPTDANGWTAADHLMHLADWLNGVNSLLEKGSQYEGMGIDRDLFLSEDYDAMNAIMAARHKGASLTEVRAALDGAQTRLIANITPMTDAELYRAYNTYAKDIPDWDHPVINTIIGNSYHHYQEHTPWIKAIAESYQVSRDDMLSELRTAWDKLNALLDSYTPEQMTQRTDAAGWTVKDHVIHLAVWEDGINALLNKQSRYQAMGLTSEQWNNTHDVDQMNASIHDQHVNMTLDEVRAQFKSVHDRLVAKVESMTTDDLHLPYGVYSPEDADEERPVFSWIGGNSYGHFEEHTPWIRAIVEQG